MGGGGGGGHPIGCITFRLQDISNKHTEKMAEHSQPSSSCWTLEHHERQD